MADKVLRTDCQGRVSPAGIIQQQVGAFLRNQWSCQKCNFWDNSTTSRNFPSKPVLLSKITFSGTCVPYGRMRWDPECPEPRCSSESRPQTPENAYSYVTGKTIFTRHTMIIPTNALGDYGSTTDTEVGSKVHQFCNENYEFVKVSIPGKHMNLPWT